MAIVKLREVRTGSGNTTDAVTPVNLATFSITTGGPGGTALDECSIFVTARCSGFVATGGNAAGEWVGAAFKVVGGVLSQVGAIDRAIPMIKDTGGTPTSDFTVAGNSINFYVTGVAATTINWFGEMEVFVNRPA